MNRFRETFSSGAPWEHAVGYSRAVRVGQVVEVSGTTAVQEGEVCYPGNAYLQAKLVLAIIQEVLHRAGASLQDVVRTRIYTTDISLWEDIGRAHGEYFAAVKPACTMVEVNALIDPDLVVEIEATAVIPATQADSW